MSAQISYRICGASASRLSIVAIRYVRQWLMFQLHGADAHIDRSTRTLRQMIRRYVSYRPLTCRAQQQKLVTTGIIVVLVLLILLILYSKLF